MTDAIRLVLTGLGLAVAAQAACRPPPADDPLSAYSAFYQAAAEGRWAVLWDMLDSRSRRCLEQAAERIARETGIPDAAAFYLKQLQGQRQAPLHSLRLVRQQDDQAELETAAGACDREETCVRRRVRLVREEGRWRISPEMKRPLLTLWGKDAC